MSTRSSVDGRARVKTATDPVAPKLWAVVVGVYVVGDAATTIALIGSGSAYVEANPIVGAALGTFGAGGLLAVKLLVCYWCLFATVWATRRRRTRPLQYAPPAILVAVGAVATASNAALLL